MKHRAQGWVSDVCLCGDKFTDRVKFGIHMVGCKSQLANRLAKGENITVPASMIQEMIQSSKGDKK